MKALDDIKKQIQSLDDASQFLGKREINELPNILWEKERILHIVQGRYNNGFGILVATENRLIFIDKGLIVGLKVEDFPYDKISSIQYQTGIFFGEITIFTSGNKAEIDQIDKKRARNFAEFVRAKISNDKVTAIHPTENSVVIIDQLERLAKLKEQGILSDEEFQIQKKKILGG